MKNKKHTKHLYISHNRWKYFPNVKPIWFSFKLNSNDLYDSYTIIILNFAITHNEKEEEIKRYYVNSIQ